MFGATVRAHDDEYATGGGCYEFASSKPFQRPLHNHYVQMQSQGVKLINTEAALIKR